MEKRYGALRIIGTIYKVLGIVAGALTIIAIIAFCATAVFGGTALGRDRSGFGSSLLPGMMGGVLGGVVGGAIAILYLGGLAVTLYAFGEGIYLLIALVANTRATMSLLAKQLGEAPPSS